MRYLSILLVFAVVAVVAVVAAMCFRSLRPVWPLAQPLPVFGSRGHTIAAPLSAGGAGEGGYAAW